MNIIYLGCLNKLYQQLETLPPVINEKFNKSINTYVKTVALIAQFHNTRLNHRITCDCNGHQTIIDQEHLTLNLDYSIKFLIASETLTDQIVLTPYLRNIFRIRGCDSWTRKQICHQVNWCNQLMTVIRTYREVSLPATTIETMWSHITSTHLEQMITLIATNSTFNWSIIHGARKLDEFVWVGNSRCRRCRHKRSCRRHHGYHKVFHLSIGTMVGLSSSQIATSCLRIWINDRKQTYSIAPVALRSLPNSPYVTYQVPLEETAVQAIRNRDMFQPWVAYYLSHLICYYNWDPSVQVFTTNP
uniref:Uncharacterized protein n=1 Tax=viral metagenome TaxID=1070528 RepID=A0A6C0BJ09_9ZZZZ